MQANAKSTQVTLGQLSLLDVFEPGSEFTHSFRIGDFKGRTVAVELQSTGDLVICSGLEGHDRAREFADVKFPTPSAAGKALRDGKPTNGWDFWYYEGRPLASHREMALSGSGSREKRKQRENQRARLGRLAEVKDGDIDRIAHVVAATYSRERDRYEGVLKTVRQEVERKVEQRLEDQAFKDRRFIVQARVKTRDSLEEKLKNRMTAIRSRDVGDLLKGIANGREFDEALCNEMLSGAEVLDELPDDARSLEQRTLDACPDLVGIRLLAYANEDRKIAVKALKGLERVDEITEDNPEVIFLDELISAESIRKETNSAYDADHVRLLFTSSNASGQAGGAVRCEVQITTVMSHILNEASHSPYKDPEHPDSRILESKLTNLKLFAETMQGVLDEFHRDWRQALPKEQKKAAKLAATSENGDDRAEALVVDLFSGAKASTSSQVESRREQVREWISQLLKYVLNDPGETGEQLMAELTNARALKPRTDKKQQEKVLRAYNRIFEGGQMDDPQAKRRLDPERFPTDAYVIEVLQVLPDRILESFVEDKGVRGTRPGRPSLIVSVVRAFLMSEST